MKLEIITPEKKLYEGEITLIKVPGSKGSFEVLKNHAPIISTLEKGTIKIVTDNKDDLFIDVEGGIIEVQRNKIIILADISG
ncbi:MAG: ATP synthase F1 subunit epsilon [Bacteroidales bacterium]|nr:ATP synthase F1 subunit epsilon [Bacteroidales bacterium]